MRKINCLQMSLLVVVLGILSQTSNSQGLPARSAEPPTNAPASKENKQTDSTQPPTGDGSSKSTTYQPPRSVMITVGGDDDESEVPKKSNLKSDGRLAAALMNDDLTALKDLIDNKGVDIETPLDQTGVKALQWAVEWYSGKTQLLPVQEQILRFLLERCADKTQPLAWLKQQSAEINEKLNKAISENYMVRVWQSKKEGNQRILDIVSNAPTCTKKTSQTQKQSDNEQVSTTDWVEKFSVGNSSVIMVRNNSKNRSIIMRGSDVFQCENVAAGGCGFKTEGVIVRPGEILSLRVVPPSDSKQAHTFQYQYWAEFAK